MKVPGAFCALTVNENFSDCAVLHSGKRLPCPFWSSATALQTRAREALHCLNSSPMRLDSLPQRDTLTGEGNVQRVETKRGANEIRD